MKIRTIISIIAILAFIATVTAQEPLLINFQGFLADSSGNPVPNGNHYLMFMLYNDSTGLSNPFWTETHPTVQTTDGLFRVQLGSITPLSLLALGEEPKFLEIIVEDQALMPRMRLTTVPNAVYAQQLKGDIVTEPGSFLFRSTMGDSAIVFGANGITNAITVRGIDPGDNERVRISSGIGGEASFVMFNPQPEPPEPLIELRTLQNDASYFAMNNLTGTEVGPLIEMTTDPTASSRIKIHAAQPTFSGRVEIQAEYTDGAHMTLFREGATPHNEIKAMDLRVGSDIGGEFKIFNYASTAEQELLSISGSPSSGASFVMFNPQPEPPEPLLEMMTGLTGGQYNMYSPQNGRTAAEAIEITTSDSGGSMQFYSEMGTHVWLSIDTDGSEGNMTFSNSDGMPTVNISSLGNVGIGTSTPLSMLHVEDKAHVKGLMLPHAFDPDTAYIGDDGNYIAFGHTGVSEDFIGYKNNTFYFKDSPTGADVLEPNVVIGGNVGIGTETPARKLHINDVMRLQPRVDYPASPGEGDICIVGGPAGNHIYCYLNGGWRQLD